MTAFITLILSFVPAYFLISITPGFNMLSSMNISSVYGKNTAFPFIVGAVLGVAFVAILSVLGVTTVITKMPVILEAMKYAGAAFLCYIGYVFLKDRGAVSRDVDISFASLGTKKLLTKGFLVAILNPKGWLFFVSFLPVFLMKGVSLGFQTILIVAIVIMIEAFCMVVYAFGGDLLGRFLSTSNNVKILHLINAAVMFTLAFILVFR